MAFEGSAGDDDFLGSASHAIRMVPLFDNVRPERKAGEAVSCTESHMDACSGTQDATEDDRCASRTPALHARLQLENARMIQVRHRSHATYSRQPRQVRKEATVTGSCVCSESPVPGYFFSLFRLSSLLSNPRNRILPFVVGLRLQRFTSSLRSLCARNVSGSIQMEQAAMQYRI